MTAGARVPRPRLTVAVVHHHLAGYPEDCLASLGAERRCEEREFLLVGGAGAGGVGRRFQHVRVLHVGNGDRAEAKNAAIREARGEFVLLVTADTLARRGAVDALLRFLESRADDAAVSAQLLVENGNRRRTDFPLPGLLRATDVIRWTHSRLSKLCRSRLLPLRGGARRARSLHATFLMARRGVFERVGPFSGGYRFACEDLEWCVRASRMGVGLFVLPEAHVFKLAPQRRGPLSPAVRVTMERSFQRFVESTRGRAYARAYRAARFMNCLAEWAVVGPANLVTGGSSPFLRNEEAVLRALLTLRAPGEAVPEDVESHVRWESDY